MGAGTRADGSLEDDFFDSLLSDISVEGNSAKEAGGSQSRGQPSAGRYGDTTDPSSFATASSNKFDEDGFFGSLRSELSRESPPKQGRVRDRPNSNQRRASDRRSSKTGRHANTNSANDDDDFFSSLTSSLQRDVSSSGDSLSSSSLKSDEDDFFASLSSALSTADATTTSTSDSSQPEGALSSKGPQGGKTHEDDDFLASFISDMESAADSIDTSSTRGRRRSKKSRAACEDMGLLRHKPTALFLLLSSNRRIRRLLRRLRIQGFSSKALLLLMDRQHRIRWPSVDTRLMIPLHPNLHREKKSIVGF